MMTSASCCRRDPGCLRCRISRRSRVRGAPHRRTELASHRGRQLGGGQPRLLFLPANGRAGNVFNHGESGDAL